MILDLYDPNTFPRISAYTLTLVEAQTLIETMLEHHVDEPVDVRFERHSLQMHFLESDIALSFRDPGKSLAFVRHVHDQLRAKNARAFAEEPKRFVIVPESLAA